MRFRPTAISIAALLADSLVVAAKAATQNGENDADNSADYFGNVGVCQPRRLNEKNHRTNGAVVKEEEGDNCREKRQLLKKWFNESI